MEVDKKSSTIDTSDTVNLFDMPEGEPDDESAVFPNSPEMFSEKYREAILVLDRVHQKPEIIGEIASYKIKLRLDDNSELNFMSKDLCECLLQQPKSMSKTELTENPVINYAPARYIIRTNLTVAGHTFVESFIIIEDTALIIAAIGKSTITELLPYIASHIKFSGPVDDSEIQLDNFLHNPQQRNINKMEKEYQEWLDVQKQLNQMLKYEQQLKQTLVEKTEEKRRELQAAAQRCDHLRTMIEK